MNRCVDISDEPQGCCRRSDGLQPVASQQQIAESETGAPNSTAGEDRLKAGLGQDAGHFLAFVALDLDPALLHGASRAARLLHLLCQLLLLGQTDADEIRHDGHRLSTAPGGLTDDIHPAAGLAGRLGPRTGISRTGREAFAVETGEWVVGKITHSTGTAGTRSWRPVRFETVDVSRKDLLNIL